LGRFDSDGARGQEFELTEEKQGGTQPPAEASAEAPAADQAVGTVAVADAPASSPTLADEAPASDSEPTDGAQAEAPTSSMTEDSEQVTPPEAVAPEAQAAEAQAAEPQAPEAQAAEPQAPEALAPETGTPESVASAEPSTTAAETAAGEETSAAGATDVATDTTPAGAGQAGEAGETAQAGEPIAGEADAAAAPTTADTDAEAAEQAKAADTEAGAPAEAEAPKPRPVPTGPEPTTMEELLAEQDSDIKSFKHGDVVEGTVVRIDKDEILVDIGAKSEGVVSNRELFGRNTEAQPALAVGDVVLVYVLQPESPEGHVVLSLRRAGLERKWRSMQEQFEAGVIIEAPVIDHNKGGLIVDCGIRGFVPISQIVDFPRRPQNDQPRDAAQEIAEKLMPFVGRKLRLKILEVNRKANRLILSEKVALYEERREKRDELFSSLQVGQKVTGSVRSIAPFGVFVDLGGIDGLVHKSELSWNKVNNPEGGYRVGEEVEAEVIDINHERGRISLSIRRLQPDPWHSTVADFKVGDIIDGTVTKLVNFGAFVRVRDGLEGLIHISELSNQRVAHPGDVVHEGQALKLRIISLDSERHRLGLSLKQAEEAGPLPVAEEGAVATAPQPRPERGERPERGDRRPRGGDRERTRSYTAADAVQEPEGGIDTTLAAAFAGVREQLARAEAGDEDTEAATAEAPAADEAEATETAPEGVAETAAEPEAATEAVSETAVEPETAEPEAATEAVAEPTAEPDTAPEAVAEPAAEPEAIPEAEAAPPTKPAKAVAEPAVEPDTAPEVVAEPEAAPADVAPEAEPTAEAAPEPEPEAPVEEPAAAPAKGAKGKQAAQDAAATPDSEEKAVS
jgi:small subunit ribosomal protein S1